MTFLIAMAAVLQPKPATIKSVDLTGTWEGLSVCADKRRFPTVRDEQVVLHATVKDGKTVLVKLNKIVQGKEEEMAPEPLAMTFDPKSLTLTGRIGGRKPSVWLFHLNYSTWVGEARTSEGELFRNVLVKRRD